MAPAVGADEADLESEDVLAGGQMGERVARAPPKPAMHNRSRERSKNWASSYSGAGTGMRGV